MTKKLIKGASGGQGGTVAPNTLQSDSFAKWVDLVCEGPIVGFGPTPDSNPLNGVYFNNVAVSHNPIVEQIGGQPIDGPNPTFNYEIANWDYQYGNPDQPFLKGFTDTQTVQVVGTQVWHSTPVVHHTSGPGVDELTVTLGCDSLQYLDPSSGDVTSTSVHLQIWIQPVGYTSTDPDGSWLLAANCPITGKASSTWEIDYKFPLPDNSVSWNIKVMRISVDSHLSNLQNNTFWYSWTETQYVKQNYPNSVVFGANINAEYFGSSMPSRSYLVKGLKIQIPDNYYPDLVVYSATQTNPCQITIQNHGLPSGTNNAQITFFKIPGMTQLNGQTYTASYVDANTLSINVDATHFSAFPSSSQYLYGKAYMYNGIWDGTFKTAWTNNPAWCLYDICTNTTYGLGVNPYATEIDSFGLYTIAQYCDGMVPDGSGGYEQRYTMNCVIRNRDEAQKQLALMASNFFGGLYTTPSGIGFVQDCYQAPSQYVMTVTPANVVDGIFTYAGSALSDRHTVCLVTWNNPDLLYQQDIEPVVNQKALLRYGYYPTSMAAFGCTSRGQAHRIGDMILDTEYNSTETVTYRAGLDHAYVMPGQIFGVMDPAYSGVRFGGRIANFVDNGGSYTVTLDAPITLAAYHSYAFGCMIPNEDETGFMTLSSSVLTGAGTTATLTVAHNSWPSTPQIGSIWVVSDTETDGVAPRPFVCVSKKEVTSITTEVTGVLYDPTKYARVEQNLKLDPPTYSTYLNNISVVVPSPSNLVVNDVAYANSAGTLLSKAVLFWDNAGGPNAIASDQYTINFGGITVTSSPFSWTNTFSVNAFVDIEGGTVSNVTLNGTQVASYTNQTITVPPGQTLIVTYSAAPILDYTALPGSNVTFTVGPNAQFLVGSRVTAYDINNADNYMSGKIVSFSSVTLTVAIDNVAGSGTPTSWNIVQAMTGTVAYYGVWYQSITTGKQIYAGPSNSNFMDLTDLAADNYTFSVVAYDNLGNASQSATVVAAINPLSETATINPQTKSIIYPLWEIAQAEYSSIVAMVQQDSHVGTALTNFTNAYNALSAYVSSSGIFNDLTSSSSVDFTTWNSDYVAYQTTRTALVVFVGQVVDHLSDGTYAKTTATAIDSNGVAKNTFHLLFPDAMMDPDGSCIDISNAVG
jgi:predicted phage tail protein